jgi:hypothetical protein
MTVEAIERDVLFARPTDREKLRSEDNAGSPVARWNPDDFAREQIRGLVRQVFFSANERPVRQVVFSAMDRETEVRNICRRIGETLAMETTGSIAVVGEYPQDLRNRESYEDEASDLAAEESAPQRRIATRVRSNLWLVPAEQKEVGKCQSTASLHSYLSETRREFEYSIVQGSAAGEASEALALAQFADGIVLVLSAQFTRKIAARKIKLMLEAAPARILGTILSDRVFPIPAGIYSRL